MAHVRLACETTGLAEAGIFGTLEMKPFAETRQMATQSTNNAADLNAGA